MTPQALKNSVLQLAIQGKLVEQRPEEGTGEELFRQIQIKKTELIISRKIKKEKNYSRSLKYNQLPFEIPDSWTFARLGELMISRDSERIPVSTNERNKREKVYDYYGASGVIDKIDNYIFDKELLLIGEYGANLLTRSTPIAFLASGKYWVNNHAHVLDACCDLNLKYICYHINAINLAPYVTGTAQPKMNQENMNAIWIALPPLAEQKRIVTKIEEILPLIDRYEQAWSRMEEFNKRFPEDMQKSILQMAIQGKLVEQRPEEGTAEELYLQIRAEKQTLVNEGKIKKQKPLPDITEEEIPFDIPNNWTWVRLDDLVIKDIKRGKSPTYVTKSNTLVFAQKCNTKAGYIDLNLSLFLDEKKLSKYPESEFMRDKDIVINSTGNGTLGRVGIYRDSDNPRQLSLVPDSHVTVIRVSSAVCVGYVFYGLKHYQPYLEKLGSGSTNQTELSANSVRTLLFPLPPLAEQERIVAKLEELLPLCEELK